MKKIIIFTLVLLTVVACKEKGVANDSVAVDTTKTETPVLKGCTKEAKICPNGDTVGRNPKNNCKFDPCKAKTEKKPVKKEAVMCTADMKECTDGSLVGRDHYNNCKFKDCPSGGEKTSKEM